MKSKTNFIADNCAQFMPYLDWDVDKAISYAERLYDRMIERGYGSKPVNHKSSENHYDKLNASQKTRFDKFWKIYGLAKSKQGSAMRWLQLEKSGEILKNEELIYQEAQKEKENRGDNPPHAQRWLSERRYADAVLDTKEKVMSDEERILRQDIAHAKTMLSIRNDTEYWESEVKRLTEKLEQNAKQQLTR